MSALRPRAARISGLLATSALLSTGLLTATPAAAVTGPDAPAGAHPYAVRLTIGNDDTLRACTGTLVERSWVLTAASCLATTPGATVPPGKPALATTATLGDGKTVAVTEIAPRADRDVALVRLATPVTTITPATLAHSAPAPGTELKAVGFGRTTSEWVPDKPHTGAFALNTTDATTLALTGKGTDALCKGDTGGPLLNAAGELVGVNSRSWQGGCLGADPAETRTGAIAARADGLGDWIDDVRSRAAGWKTEALVQVDNTVYQGIRLADGSWTGFADVQTKAGSIDGVRSAAAAGINGETHVLAISNDGRLFHTIRKADGSWGTFGDVGAAAGVLSNLTQVSAVSIGTDLHVVAVAGGGKVFHTVRHAAGDWTRFGDVVQATSPIGPVTQVATASAGGQLQVIAISAGKAFHTLRNTAGQWTVWGNVAQAAGATGPITSVSMAGIGGDVHVVIATDNGTRQYHTIRQANASWIGFGELTGYLGNVTAKSLAAAHVDGELQVAAVTADNKFVHTVRHTDRTWTTTPAALRGISGTAGAICVTGTL
ncbi:trypsin-like serine protease [Streptomyces sp. NPDC001373]|uniref:trypsin-like serine protease n=1 Tax=Streptomyces sp. NPDC001373 TaxID=3364565 RepID=UPI0036985797